MAAGPQTSPDPTAGQEGGERGHHAPEHRRLESEEAEGDPRQRSLRDRDGERRADGRHDQVVRLRDHPVAARRFEGQQLPDEADDPVAVAQKVEEAEQHHEQLEDEARDVLQDGAGAAGDVRGDGLERVDERGRRVGREAG